MAELKEMIKRPANSPPRRKKLVSKPMTNRPEWNSTPLRKEPPALRGIKTNREPWAKDEGVYAAGMQGHGAVARGPPPRARAPSPEKVEAQYNEEYSKWMKRTGWNPAPFRNAPDPIKGLKPVTREPWYEDMAIVSAAPAPMPRSEEPRRMRERQ